MDENIHVLKGIGLTLYEAQAYVTMTSLISSTATEISEKSNIPRSKIYDVLKKLAEKNFIEMKEKYGLTKLKWVTEGGDTFQGSVLNGIRYLEDKIDKDDVVLIHFGASPFITGDIISDCIKVCNEKGNAISTTDFYLLSGKKKSNSSVSDPDNYTDEYINRDTVAIMNK